MAFKPPSPDTLVEERGFTPPSPNLLVEEKELPSYEGPSGLNATRLEPGRAYVNQAGPTSTTYGGPPKPVASFGETMVEPAEEMLNPRFTTPKLTVNPDDHPAVAIGKTAVNIASSIPEFFSSNLGVVSMAAGAAAPVAVAGAFTVDMLKSAGEQIHALYKDWDQMTKAQHYAALTEIGGTGLMAMMTGTHATRGVLDKVVPARAVAKMIKESEFTPVPKSDTALVEPWSRAVAPPMVTDQDLLTRTAPLTSEAVKAVAEVKPKGPESVPPPAPVEPKAVVPPVAEVKPIESPKAFEVTRRGITKRGILSKNTSAGNPKESASSLEAIKMGASRQGQPEGPWRFTEFSGDKPTWHESFPDYRSALKWYESRKAGWEEDAKLGIGKVKELPLPSSEEVASTPPPAAPPPAPLELKAPEPVAPAQQAEVAPVTPEAKVEAAPDAPPESTPTAVTPSAGPGVSPVAAETKVVVPEVAVTKVKKQVKKVAATEGQMTAKEVKAEYVQRVEDELDKVVSKQEWTVTQNAEYPQRWELKAKDGNSIAVDVENTDKGFTGTVFGVAGGKKTVKGKTIDDVLYDAKAHASSEGGSVTINIPGDGDVTVFKNGTALVELRDRARRIATSSGGKPPVIPTGERGKVDADEIAGQAKAVYGDNAKAIAGIDRQLASEQEMEPGQRELLERAAQVLREDTPEFKRQKRIDELKDSIDTNENAIKYANERLTKVRSEMKSANGTAKQRNFIRDQERSIQDAERELKSQRAEYDRLNEVAQAEAKPTPAAPAPVAEGKQPWEMTQLEVAGPKKFVKGSDQPNPLWTAKAFGHYRTVREAVESGKPVPPEVLADYPDLAKSTPTAEEAKGIGGQAFKDLRDKLDRNEGGGRDFTKSIVDAGTYLYEKGMKFADWSARMVKEFGENVRDWLQDVWTRITDLADFDVQQSAQYNQPYIPVKILGTDGKVYDAQFNGHYDMRAYGGGLNYSIGREISPGHWSHGLLRPGEKLISRVPSPEKWAKLKVAEKARKATYIPHEIEAGAGIPPISISDISKSTKEIIRSAKDFHLFNRINSPQFLYYFGKLGQAAKSAWETMAVGEFQMREATRKDVETAVRQPLKALPREFRKQGGKALFDVINGKTMDDIRTEWQGKPNGESVIAQAGIVKGRLEEIRTTIRDLKRDSFNRYLNGVNKETLQDLFRENVSREADISRMTKEELADAVSREQFPDDWGISDGSYLPHLFFGQWKVTVRRPGSEGSQFITRSQTIQEAKARIYEQTKADPTLNDAHFTIEQDTVVPADMIRLGDRRFWNLVGKMKEQNMEPAAVHDALRGNIGRKSTKQKWFGSLQERKGFEGYSKNYERAMIAYLSGFHRWRVLNEVNQKTQPLIEQVRREGRLNAAQNLEYILDNLWGKPTVATREFDAFMRRIPVARDFIKPMALDRWARAATQLTGLLTLRTLRFSVVNRLQPLQGLYPLIGERGIIEAKIMQHTDAGRKLLQEAGVELDPGQYASELSGTSSRRSMIERFSGERSNQELAFLGMYQHARKLGISHAEAVVYGKLRGQLMTQFTPLLTDTPALFNGPFGRVMFQFKRFPVKQVELMSKMVSDRNVPAIARLVASFGLLGGLSFLLRQTWATDNDTRLRIKRSLDKSLGTKGGDALMYGLPGYMGADISGSITLGDEPIGQNIYEKGARLLTGPAISLGIQTTKHFTTEKRQPTRKVQDVENFLRKFPLTKPLGELSGLLRGDIDVHTPDGESKLRRKMTDALMGIGSFRSANEANISLAVNGIMALAKEESRLKNNYYASPDKAAANKEIRKFNRMWPEAAITEEDLNRYVKYREAGRNKTDAERIARKKYQLLLPPSQRSPE